MRNHSFIFNEKFCGVAACRRGRIPATFRCIGFRESGVRSAVFREQALLHYPACCAASGSVPQQGSANRCYCIALHIPRTTGTANNISMPRSGRRLGRATFYYLKQIAAHSTRLNVGCYAQWRICFCVAH